MDFEHAVRPAMKRARDTWIAVALASTAAISCAPSADNAQNPFDAGSGGGPPEIICSNDSTCGSARACFASRCVLTAENIGAWAIEIDPPARSGSQVTELPSGSATPVITASAEFDLTVSFRGSDSVGAGVPSSAAAIVTVPSQIPGQPDLSFQNMVELGIADPVTRTTNASATINLPAALRGQMATLSLIPLPPSDQATPPHTFTITIPLAGQPLFALDLPANSRALRGRVLDAVDNPKTQFTARAFQNGVMMSTVARTETTATNPAGNFVLILPGNTPGDGITLELAPMSGTSDPWVTYSGLSLTQQNTDLGTITLPATLATADFQVTVHGGDAEGMPVSDATVRAYTTLEGDDTRMSARFVREARSDGRGTANISLMPGATGNPRPYTLSVVPPSGSIWATQCFDNVPAKWPGGAPVTLLRDVTLPRRAVITGSVVSANGAPVSNVIVSATATGGEPRCRIAWPDRPSPARPLTRRGRSRCASIRVPTSSNTTRRLDHRSRG
jgi:hypothetical protein